MNVAISLLFTMAISSSDHGESEQIDHSLSVLAVLAEDSTREFGEFGSESVSTLGKKNTVLHISL